jgi:adenine/guanine phosphoribosyltransferase-like PRPP-binding protein
VVASETVALDVAAAEFVREVEPGEIVTISDRGMESRRFAEAHPRPAHCVFEHVYFASPASVVFGQNVQIVRERLGEILATEAHVPADFVMPMPDSGRSAAAGYARACGLPYREGIVPNRYVGRTFIKPTQTERNAAVRLKLNVIAEIVRGKRVIVVDDSIVRGTTTRAKMEQIRQAGAKEIHLRISCPPIRHPCFFGVDFAERSQLIATGRSIDEIRKYLGVDSLHYLTQAGMLSAMDRPREHYCTACYDGDYRIDVEHPVTDLAFAACDMRAVEHEPCGLGLLARLEKRTSTRRTPGQKLGAELAILKATRDPKWLELMLEVAFDEAADRHVRVTARIHCEMLLVHSLWDPALLRSDPRKDDARDDAAIHAALKESLTSGAGIAAAKDAGAMRAFMVAPIDMLKNAKGDLEPGASGTNEVWNAVESVRISAAHVEGEGLAHVEETLAAGLDRLIADVDAGHAKGREIAYAMAIGDACDRLTYCVGPIVWPKVDEEAKASATIAMGRELSKWIAERAGHPMSLKFGERLVIAGHDVMAGTSRERLAKLLRAIEEGKKDVVFAATFIAYEAGLLEAPILLRHTSSRADSAIYQELRRAAVECLRAKVEGEKVGVRFDEMQGRWVVVDGE